MDQLIDNLRENLIRTQRALLNQYHDQETLTYLSKHDKSSHTVSRIVDANTRMSERINQTYPLDHGLSPEEMRILLRILAKDLPDVGRKRGAILRYIASYKEEVKVDTSKTLYNYLTTQNDTTF